MKDAKKIYNDLWNKSFPLLESAKYEIDRSINDPADPRRGLTIRARLSTEVISEIEKFTEKLKRIIPNQYFTPLSELHITVLTVISCNPEFRYDPILNNAYCEVIGECIKGIMLPEISFQGITVSPSCLLLCGFPETNSLKELRNKLRRRFDALKLPNSADLRYPLKTAHITLMRFTEDQGDISGLTQFIQANKNVSFGTQIIDEIEFVTNDWCHKQNNTQIIRTFKLQKTVKHTDV